MGFGVEVLQFEVYFILMDELAMVRIKQERKYQSLWLGLESYVRVHLC